ncbi:MAG: marine proteobacterial sortase target protein [Gammaproteobacteria bacterium]|nr:marine proteobacterial sortase target protein [Gammaproteobacteria bacterium]
MQLVNQRNLIVGKSPSFSSAKAGPEPHTEYIVISKSEYRRLHILQGLLLIVLLGLLPGLVLASPLPENITAGSLFVKQATGELQPALRLETDVQFDISGLLARTKLKQHFKNDSAEWVEGIYVFPLPDNAAVDRLRIRVGERIIEGVIREKAAAKNIYRTARASGQRAALVEQERPNMFTTSVANIGPGETIVVEIAYQQLLQYQNGRFSLRFPMTITPRYIPGQPDLKQSATDSPPQTVQGFGWSPNTSSVPDASRITPPVKSLTSREQNSVHISARLTTGFPLAKVNSLYHDIQLSRQSNLQQNVYDIELQQGRVPMDRDFELVWQAAAGTEPNAAFFTENINGENYGLIMLMPPQIDNALVEMQKTLPREVVFIIDTSGSMAGVAIRQAKQALNMALQTLTANDRFNIIEFNSITRSLFTQPVFADSQSVQLAMQFVNNLQADGGTEMAPAIRSALETSELDGYVRQVIFMTDGSVGNESELFALIENKLANSRLFTVGIGAAPNSYFMRKAAQFGRGSYTFISAQDEIASRMQMLFKKLQAPVLTDLELVWSGAEQPEIWPRRLPDLYRAQPLLITAKLSDSNEQLVLTGKILGKQWQKKLNLKSDQNNEGIASLWARNKIADLMDQHVHGGDAQQIKQQVTDIALQHRLVSQYTSLVVVDPLPVRPADELLNKTAVANLLPAGSQQNIQAYGFPQGATMSRMYLLLAFCCGLLAITFLMIKRHYEK